MIPEVVKWIMQYSVITYTNGFDHTIITHTHTHTHTRVFPGGGGHGIHSVIA